MLLSLVKYLQQFVLVCRRLKLDEFVAGRVGRKDSQRKTSLLFTEQGLEWFGLFIMYARGDKTRLGR